MAFGYRLTIDKFNEYAQELARKIIPDDSVDAGLKTLLGEIIATDQSTQQLIEVQRERIAKAKDALAKVSTSDVKHLIAVIDFLVKKSVWAFGGDGWAYDIGYGGVDHVLASGKNVNVLVLDTEVYSNTGGQSSKSTPMGAVAKFAAGGKPTIKKDMGLIAMSYGYIYVARVAIGANQNQTVKAFIEAENYDGPSLLLCYSHCINHGFDMVKGCEAQKLAVESGHWPLYRYNPERLKVGQNPLQLDSRKPRIQFREFAERESRFQILLRSRPAEAQHLLALAQQDVDERWNLLSQMAEMHYEPEEVF